MDLRPTSRLVWSDDRRPPGAALHSWNEPSELSRRLGHNDGTINIVLTIIITSAGRYYDHVCLFVCLLVGFFVRYARCGISKSKVQVRFSLTLARMFSTINVWEVRVKVHGQNWKSSNRSVKYCHQIRPSDRHWATRSNSGITFDKIHDGELVTWWRWALFEWFLAVTVVYATAFR